MAGAGWGGGKWAGVRRGFRLLVHRQMSQGVGSVSEQAKSMGGAELSIYLAMIDVQKKLKELDAKIAVLWNAHQLAHGETE